MTSTPAHSSSDDLKRQALLAQLHSRYPAAMLLADLLTIHDGSYVVRAVVQWGNTLLASGMAAHPSLEQAEDRAKLRALESLSLPNPFTPPLPAPMSAPTPSFPTYPRLGDARPEEAPTLEPLGHDRDNSAPASAAIAPDVAPSRPPTPIQPSLLSQEPPHPAPELPLPSGQPSLPLAPVSPLPMQESIAPIHPNTVPIDRLSLPLPEPDLEDLDEMEIRDRLPEPDPSSSASSRARPSKGKKTASMLLETAPESINSTEPQDYSDLIAQIGVQVERVGWTPEQGKAHLKQTYNKRSRQHLSYAELVDFLNYLESQPTSLPV